jgi:metal-responsive CopG/Arc/MetJ family transcriptional regulator
MKIAISIPDPVFLEAENLAKRLGITRSKLYARALGSFVASQTPERITEAMNAALEAAGDGRDPFAKEGARRIFSRSEW